MRHNLWELTKWFFFALPAFDGLLLGAVAFAIVFVKELDNALKDRVLARRLLAVGILVFGITGFVADRVNSHLEKTTLETERGAASEERKVLRGQIGTLLATAQVQASKDDLQSMTATMNAGMSRIEAAIKGVKVSPVTPLAAQSIAPPSLKVIQRQAPTNNPSAPYGVQVIIQPDTTLQGVGIAIECSDSLDNFQFFIAGSTMSMNNRMEIIGDNRNVARIHIGYPPATPNSPMVVNLYSKKPIRATKISLVP